MLASVSGSSISVLRLPRLCTVSASRWARQSHLSVLVRRSQHASNSFWDSAFLKERILASMLLPNLTGILTQEARTGRPHEPSALVSHMSRLKGRNGTNVRSQALLRFLAPPLGQTRPDTTGASDAERLRFLVCRTSFLSKLPRNNGQAVQLAREDLMQRCLPLHSALTYV